MTPSHVGVIGRVDAQRGTADRVQAVWLCGQRPPHPHAPFPNPRPAMANITELLKDLNPAQLQGELFSFHVEPLASTEP